MLKTLINWGIPRAFSETNPCIHVPKLEVEEDGARPWPVWAYSLIEEHAREDMQRAVLLARYTGQRQADVLRMAPEHIDDSGINVTQQKIGKELWVPLHADLKGALDHWSGSPYVQTAKGDSYTPDALGLPWTPYERHARRQNQAGGLHLSLTSCIERREAAATAGSRASPVCRRQ